MNNHSCFAVHDLSYSYHGTPVFEHINETFRSEEMNILMSPSGSGKSTLLLLIAGILPRQSGSIEYPIESPLFSMVFQENRLLESQSILCNLKLTNSSLNAQTVSAVLRAVGLSYTPDKKICHLSGGEKRRIAILRAILSPYDILLMDEPFTGLDEASKLLMMKFVKEKTAGRTVILVTHNKAEADYFECPVSRCLG